MHPDSIPINTVPFLKEVECDHDIQSRVLNPTGSIDTLTGTWTRVLKYAAREGYIPSSSLIEFCVSYAREHEIDCPTTYA